MPRSCHPLLVTGSGAASCITQVIWHQPFKGPQHIKPLSTRMVQHIVHRWGDYSGAGKVSPHDLPRTAITRALDQGLSYRQGWMMSGHADPKTVMRYDHNRENLDQNAVNLLNYD